MALIKEDYGLIYNNDGSLCVTVRDDDVPFQGVKSFAVEESTTNLITNPLFNDGYSSFNLYNSTYEILNSDLFNNSNMAKISRVDNNNHQFGNWQRINNISGDTYYTVSAYLKSDNPTVLTIAMEINDINGNRIETQGKNVSLTNKFKKFEFTVLMPVDANYVTFTFYKKNYTVEEDSFYITAVQVEKKPFATSFVDGYRRSGRMSLNVLDLQYDNFVFSCWANHRNTEDLWQMLATIFTPDDSVKSEGNHYSIRRNNSGEIYLNVNSVDNGTSRTPKINLSEGWRFFLIAVHDGLTDFWIDNNKYTTGNYVTSSLDKKIYIGDWKGTAYQWENTISNIFIGEYKDKNGNVIWTDEYIQEVYEAKKPFNTNL
jgi:hypothetical protein